MKIYAVILASGAGSRLGLEIPKQFYKIKNKTILEYSIAAFESHPLIDEIIVVSNPDFIDLAKKTARNFNKATAVVAGGKTRQQSSFIGLSQITDINSKVLIHDAVRPFVSHKIISDCISALKHHNAVNVTVEISDTVMEINGENVITGIIERSKLVRCQTPQGFDYSVIKQAHEAAINDNITATDDCSLVLGYNLADIYAVKGSDMNIKITYPVDLKTAEYIMSKT